MQTKFDIGQKVFYVYQEYESSPNKVLEGFIYYIKIWPSGVTEYGITETWDTPNYKCTVPEYAIGLTESKAVRSHFTHKAEEQFKQLGESLQRIKQAGD